MSRGLGDTFRAEKEQFATETFMVGSLGALVYEIGGMSMLAERTGAVAFLNTNEPAAAVNQAMTDLSCYYLIAYQPDADTFDAKAVKFNTLEVKVNKPDLKIRSRKGFYSIKDNEADK